MNVTMMNVRRPLRQLHFFFSFKRSALLHLFLDKGIIDSTGVLEFVSFLEEQYQIKIQDEDLVPDNLDSINKTVAFVNRKRGT